MRRVTLAYVVYFAAIGAGFPYLPVYYRSLGLDLGAVGAVTAVQAATQLVMAPVWGGLADAFPRTRMTLPLAAVVAAVGGAWLALVGILGGGLPVVVAGAVILFAGLAGIGPILDARTLETLGPDRDRYGQVRAWGSLSFVVVASLVGVLIDRFGDRSMFVAYVPLLVGTAVVTMTIARRGEIRSVTVVRDARAFLAAPRVAIFLTGSFLVWTSLNGTNSFYSIQVVALGGAVAGAITISGLFAACAAASLLATAVVAFAVRPSASAMSDG